MKPFLFIANWKSKKTLVAVREWLEIFTQKNESKDQIIIAPSFPHLDFVKNFSAANMLSFSLAAQDISSFPEGAFTGEVNGVQIKEFAEYVIIGHSERRNLLKETDDLLAKKVDQALRVGLIPIFCVQNENVSIPAGVRIVSYEPDAAIGTGNPDDAAHANIVAEKIKAKYPALTHVIYGGSVSAENVQEFSAQEHINGVLVGTKSISPEDFIGILKHA